MLLSERLEEAGAGWGARTAQEGKTRHETAERPQQKPSSRMLDKCAYYLSTCETPNKLHVFAPEGRGREDIHSQIISGGLKKGNGIQFMPCKEGGN